MNICDGSMETNRTKFLRWNTLTPAHLRVSHELSVAGPEKVKLSVSCSQRGKR